MPYHLATKTWSLTLEHLGILMLIFGPISIMRHGLIRLALHRLRCQISKKKINNNNTRKNNENIEEPRHYKSMRVLNVHIRFLVSPEAVRITHITLVPTVLYNNVFTFFFFLLRIIKNKTIIRVNTQQYARHQKQNTIWYTCFHNPTEPPVFSLNGQLVRSGGRLQRHILAHVIY